MKGTINMLEILLEALLEAAIDTAKLLPFLFLTYLLIEFLEHKAGEKTLALINRSGKWGPLIGGVLGVVPQCGFSAATSNLYAGGVITRGTLIAVFLSTSDEMLPILISSGAPIALILKIIALKLSVGVAAGFLIDLFARRKNSEHIRDFCEQQDCRCEEGGILRSALLHTVKISAFIALVSLALNVFVGLMGEDRLSVFILNKPLIGELLAGLVGLIPNCAASVVMTELYLSGGMSAGAMLSGLLVGSGVGLLILFRMNRNIKDNLITLGLLYAIGVCAGFLLGLLPIF